MADEKSFKLFGFEIKKSKGEDPKKTPSIVPARDDDGAGYVTAGNMYYGQYLNIDGDETKDNHQLVMQYRGVAYQPEVDMAIEDITGEAISTSELKQNIDINMDNVEGVSDSIKKQIKAEFDIVYNMLDFGEYGHDISVVGTLTADCTITWW